MEQLKDKIEAVLKKYDSYEKDVFPRIVDDLLVCALSEKEWIKCSDRMPEKDGPVLAFIETADKEKPMIQVLWYDPSGFGWSGIVDAFLNSITHWMLLPEPPKP